MINQIYRIEMSENKNLEIFICNTNELEPYRRIKEIGVVLIGNNMQIDGSLDLPQLQSLIKYLEDCKEYIQEYNNTQNTNP